MIFTFNFLAIVPLAGAVSSARGGGGVPRRVAQTVFLVWQGVCSKIDASKSLDLGSPNFLAPGSYTSLSGWD